MTDLATLQFNVSPPVVALAQAIENQEHRQYLLSGLRLFLPFTQYKLAKKYISKIDNTPSRFEDRPNCPSKAAHDWLYDFLNTVPARYELEGTHVKRAARKLLDKVEDNFQHNYIAEEIIQTNMKSSLQPIFVRRTLQTFKSHKKVKKEYKERQKNAPLDLNIETLKKLSPSTVSSAVEQLLEIITDKQDRDFVHRCLAFVPRPLQMRFAKRYLDKYDHSSAKNQYFANDWFRRSVTRLKPRLKILEQIIADMPLPWHIIKSVERTKKHSGDLAQTVTQMMTDLSQENPTWDIIDIYIAVQNFAEPLGVNLDYSNKLEKHYLQAEEAECALLKAQCQRFWWRKLKLIRARYLEYLEIATGEVGKDIFSHANKKGDQKWGRRGVSAYCSKQAVKEHKISREKGRRFLESLELVNECSDVIKLMTAVEKGMGNPENMRNELMLRLRETEELAMEMGYQGGFFNITAPSRFHANSASWDGSTPKEASQYLCKVFAQARAKLDRLDIPYFGVRVAEPHVDGCPHWHMLYWVPERYYYKFSHVLRRYFCKDDRKVFFERFKSRKKLKAQYTKARRVWGLNKKRKRFTQEPKKDYFPSSPRFLAIKMDPPTIDENGRLKGGATAYIAKYISKNIDGFSLANEYDAESGELLQESINPVKAWASTWAIRQFQFQKSPPITIWRELRRIRDEIEGNDEMEAVRAAASGSDFKTYVKLMGGMGIGRDARFKVTYEYTEYGNNYGELTKRLKGVLDTHGLYCLVTRVHTWEKQPMGTAAANSTVDEAWQDANIVGAADLSWTSGNNCTLSTTGHSDELILDMPGFSLDEIRDMKKDLLMGRKVKRNDHVYFIKDSKLEIWDVEKCKIEQRRSEIEAVAQNEAYKSSVLGGGVSATCCNHMWSKLSLDQVRKLRAGDCIDFDGAAYFVEGTDLLSFSTMKVGRIKHDVWPLFPTQLGFQLNKPIFEPSLGADGVGAVWENEINNTGNQDMYSSSIGYDGEAVVFEDHVYYVQNGELFSFAKGVSTEAPDIEPSSKHWDYARDLVALAYTSAEVADREELLRSEGSKHFVIGDLDLARLVLSGEASAISDNDWWANGFKMA
ncbi:replication endonuclease [Pseudoalteromonas luteoviolacea]|uniref:replication endonuclease n=1 Tax=Pseudoalteromonas luteoviolacea TaxID=43657 RepID=UPI001F4716CC|nr:replication endonuclease [Pseudoalteromonas luteoviolacea]MCF6442336.1 replication endonuclease [Pseudoalteromonas luteoviolacea]